MSREEKRKKNGKKKSQNRLVDTSSTNTTEKERNISLGWLNYDEKTKKFEHVREIQEGGTRPISVPSSFAKDDVLQMAIKLYLSEDERLNLDARLGNFKAKPIRDDDLQSQPKVSGHPQKKALPRFPSFQCCYNDVDFSFDIFLNLQNNIGAGGMGEKEATVQCYCLRL